MRCVWIVIVCVLGFVGEVRGEVRVVASFSVLESLVKEVGGSRVEVVSLVPRGSDPHAYRLSPGGMVEVGRADVLVFNGLGFEGWMRRVEEAGGFGGVRVEAGEGIEVRFLSGLHDDGDDGDGSGHERGGIDPHGFHSPEGVKAYGRAIMDALVSVDEEGVMYYEERYRDFEERVESLDREIRDRLGVGEMKEGEVIVVGHAGLGYFGDAYGLAFEEVEGLTGVSTLSGKRVVAIKEKGESVRGVVYEYGRNPRFLRLLAEEMGVVLGGPFYVDTLDTRGVETRGVEDWFSMMRHNADVVVEVLRGGD